MHFRGEMFSLFFQVYYLQRLLHLLLLLLQLLLLLLLLIFHLRNKTSTKAKCGAISPVQRVTLSMGRTQTETQTFSLIWYNVYTSWDILMFISAYWLCALGWWFDVPSRGKSCRGPSFPFLSTFLLWRRSLWSSRPGHCGRDHTQLQLHSSWEYGINRLTHREIDCWKWNSYMQMVLAE